MTMKLEHYPTSFTIKQVGIAFEKTQTEDKKTQRFVDPDKIKSLITLSCVVTDKTQ